MYTFSSKLKNLSIILMALGLLGIGYGFLTAPKDIQEVEMILAAESHGAHGEQKHDVSTDGAESHDVVGSHNEVVPATGATESAAQHVEHSESESHDVASEAAEHEEHLTHVLHQLQNKPWAALYVACLFFLLVPMGVLAFYAIQQVAQAGWSPGSVVHHYHCHMTRIRIGPIAFKPLLLSKAFVVKRNFGLWE
jgi:hypothetical protein